MTKGSAFDGQIAFDGDKGAPLYAFAHGAGAPMDTPWMTTVTRLLVEGGLRVARFEFAYMAARRGPEGKKRPPDRQAVLEQRWRDVVAALRKDAGIKGGRVPLYIGGKSMGGRMASMVADELEVTGLVCLGYPFHPPGKPTQLRTEHLATLRTPGLIVQGTRDPLGNRDEVKSYKLAKSLVVRWIEDGDHGLKPRKKVTGRTEQEALAEAADHILAFVKA